MNRLLQHFSIQNQTDIASGLQIFFNLGELVDQVKTIIRQCQDVVVRALQHSFDVTTITREGKGKKELEIQHQLNTLF